MSDKQYIADVALTHLLSDLRAATNEILTTWQNRNPPRGEPVNWAALYCYSAGLVQDYREEMGFVVMVEEASGDATIFGDWLSEQLTLAGWPNVEVVMGW